MHTRGLEGVDRMMETKKESGKSRDNVHLTKTICRLQSKSPNEYNINFVGSLAIGPKLP